jgi:Rieske Fe-S protein
MTSAPDARPPRLSRRTAIRALGWLLAAPMPVVFASMVNRYSRLARESRRVEVPPPAADGVSFVDEVVVCRSGGSVRVFSARCTHLGCRISSAEGDLLVCPCHGSRFRHDGSVAAGPAFRTLEPLPWTADPRTGTLIVHVS